MTEVEEKRLKSGIPRETIAVERIWNKRTDRFSIKLTTTEKTGDQYVTWAKNVVVVQYVSTKSALERTLGPQGWTVIQRSFISGARSLSEEDLHDNLFQETTTRH
jgi:hypothetical protein